MSKELEQEVMLYQLDDLYSFIKESRISKDRKYFANSIYRELKIFLKQALSTPTSDEIVKFEFCCPYCESKDVNTIGAEGYDNLCKNCGKLFEDEEFLILLNSLPFTPSSTTFFMRSDE